MRAAVGEDKSSWNSNTQEGKEVDFKNTAQFIDEDGRVKIRYLDKKSNRFKATENSHEPSWRYEMRECDYGGKTMRRQADGDNSPRRYKVDKWSDGRVHCEDRGRR